MSLDNLFECDKATSLELLRETSTPELWNVFLEVQADLFFTSEAHWLEQQSWWMKAANILELGSGNGAYLSRLATYFPEKTFTGIELLPRHVQLANKRCVESRLTFHTGNAEIFDPTYVHSADVVILRLTLQHLKNPEAALHNAWQYLNPEGLLFIIDSYDPAKQGSHKIKAIEESTKLVAEIQQTKEAGNRRVTVDLLNELDTKTSPMSQCYEVVYSNLNSSGEILSMPIRLSGDFYRKTSFGQGLMFLTLLQRTFDIPDELDEAYDQLRLSSEDESAWSSPGMHLLILKKKAVG